MRKTIKNMLTGRQIFDQKIVTDALESNVQQQGIDLRVKNIYTWDGETFGYIGDKTKKPQFVKFDGEESYKSVEYAGENMKVYQSGDFKNAKTIYKLEPGYYEVEFMEGCNLGPTQGLLIRHRSSLVRCGGTLFSGWFDPGFHTDHIGCFMEVRMPITIEANARLGQALVLTSDEVKNMYNGQWQGDKQRN